MSLSRRRWTGAKRRIARLAATGACVLAAEAAALACPICFQVEDDATVNGVRAAVVVLVGVTMMVLAGVVSFTVRFVRREAALPLPPEGGPSGSPVLARGESGDQGTRPVVDPS
jgi:hypothetical protein